MALKATAGEIGIPVNTSLRPALQVKSGTLSKSKEQDQATKYQKLKIKSRMQRHDPANMQEDIVSIFRNFKWAGMGGQFAAYGSEVAKQQHSTIIEKHSLEERDRSIQNRSESEHNGSSGMGDFARSEKVSNVIGLSSSPMALMSKSQKQQAPFHDFDRSHKAASSNHLI